MRILVGYGYPPHFLDVQERVRAWLQRLRSAGFDLCGFCLVPRPPAPRLSFDELDRQWRRGDADLLGMYDALHREAERADVFVNVTGINVHPEMVRRLPTLNVYACFDDPESSEALSRPVAAAYDLAMVGNLACVDDYRAWGVGEVEFWPIGFHPDDFDPTLTEERILTGERDVEVSLLCERVSGWREKRLDRFVAAFPHGRYHGRGWPAGVLDESLRVPLMQRTRLGLNVHNSVGPVNSRTYVLPANGVLQLCDNRSRLAGLYSLGEEVVGYDEIDEAIDLARYYLAHDDERRRVAAAGFRRATRDYNEVAVFQRMVDRAAPLLDARRARAREPARPYAVRGELAARAWIGRLIRPLVAARRGLARMLRWASA